MFSGSFRLLDDNPEKPGKPLPRTVKYQGILVPGADPQGGGWFLLPQLAQPPQTKASTAPVLSGKVTVD